MDWFIWLSKTGLDPSLVYEYGLAFATNELDEEDMAYFNHEFLQSMGISIAKHRLEILKLTRKEAKTHHPIAKLFLVLKKTKKSLANYIATLVNHRNNEDRALILLPNKNKHKKNINKGSNNNGAISYSSRWRRSMMMKTNKKLVMVNNNSSSKNGKNQERLMLTNGDYLGDYLGDESMVVSTPKLGSFSSPLMYDLQQSKEEKVPDDYINGDNQEEVEDDDDQYWSPTLEEIRWDAMFQDLKPT